MRIACEMYIFICNQVDEELDRRKRKTRGGVKRFRGPAPKAVQAALIFRKRNWIGFSEAFSFVQLSG
jgi:hypothetical protein